MTSAPEVAVNIEAVRTLIADQEEDVLNSAKIVAGSVVAASVFLGRFVKDPSRKLSLVAGSLLAGAALYSNSQYNQRRDAYGDILLHEHSLVNAYERNLATAQ